MEKIVRVNAAKLKSFDDAKFAPQAVYQSQGIKVILAYFKEGQFIPVHAPEIELVLCILEGRAEVVAGEEKDLFEARVREIRDVGADEGFSTRLITLRFLDQLLEILEIARETDSDPVVTARAYYQASALFEIPWLRRKTFAAAGEGQWEHRAAQAISEDLSRAHRKLVLATVCHVASDQDDYMARVRDRDVERFRGILEELKEEDVVGLAAVSVATRELASVADRTARGAAGERRR